ncbi:carbon storage regulator CsrA [Bacillus sp. T33-2]|uniref:carbon storage regulator CsrA n=1 Tax=Bacillus sp. T33-2 TaxID=2054168 RepID=UPI000C757151|nr:carbon storage regulator CsrA [Bacillus sp. T33-2]PLR90812.1 carbon storage regulator [Bacillus sp. T33-2]
MLVLSRRKNESIVIGENIELTILEIDGDQIKIGITAPREVDILRKEIVIKTEKENTLALNNHFDIENFL